MYIGRVKSKNMSLFKKLFGGGEAETTAPTGQTPPRQQSSNRINFGRFTDCNKTREQLDFWSKSLDHFKNKRYADSFEALMHYIGDKQVNNVSVSRNGDRVDFELIQGSKIVKGYGDNKDFRAEAAIVTMKDKSVPVMRKLMTLNYGLMYSKFALKDDTLCMKFTSHALDASPNKIYYGLKELAKKADQQDDLLMQEFSSLEEIDTHNIIELSPELKELRYSTLIKYINDTLGYINSLDRNSMSGGIAFLLLNLTYSIDFLFVPQGKITESLERIQSLFFAKTNDSTADRNDKIISEFQRIANQPKEEVLEGLYDVKSTFAMANPAAHKTVMDFMFKEREKMNWYRDNNYPKIVEAVYGYMITYAYFNYGMVYPITDLLNLCMHVLHNEYYVKSGSSLQIVEVHDKLNSANLVKEINHIVQKCKAEYPHMMINTSALNFNDKVSFIDSLILQMDRMNLTKK